MATHLEYLRAAMARAAFEQTENGAWFTYIAGFDGLWAAGATRARVSIELFETFDAWLDVHTKIGGSAAPVIDAMILEAPPKLVDHPPAVPELTPCPRHEFIRKWKALGWAGVYSGHMQRTSAAVVLGAQTVTVPNVDIDVDLLSRVLRIAAISRDHFIRC